MAKKTVPVKILDQEFKLYTDAPPEKVEQITRFLNGKLNEVLSKSKNISHYHAVVLAALNIAENYFSIMDRETTFRSDVAKRSKNILELLENSNQPIQ